MHLDHIPSAQTGDGGSVLTRLRALLPDRRLTLTEALSIVELQAARLLQLSGIREAPVPITAVSDLPHIAVVADGDLARHAASGTSHWSHAQHTWMISVNPAEPLTRQRFTVLHEYWHIIMHYHPGLTEAQPRSIFGLDPVEYLAEYFAGCVLMPKRWLKSAFYAGTQDVGDLAMVFDVSPRAVEVRLAQLGMRTNPPHEAGSRRFRTQPRSRGSSASSHGLRRPYMRAAQRRLQPEAA